MTTHFETNSETNFETTSRPGSPGPEEGPPPAPTAVQEPAVPGAPAEPPAPGAGEPRPPFARRLWRGRPEDNRWVRPGLLLALLVIGGLYTWNLTASGYANSFYSAAVQAGSQSWKAFFFGSLDSGNAITVDKPPASLWPMALSVRVLGLNSFAILFPQVLMAVATAGVLWAAVRRRFDATAGFLTMAVFALTPVAALMFRFNNPDAALALLMAVAVYCTQRALEKAQTKWLVWAGVAIGLAFLVKTLQAFLILPVLALVYVVFAPASVKKRVGQVLLAGLAMIVSGGWWVAIVELWPASSRPYIGGSQNNSFLELTFGYNGLGRLNGEETGSVGGGGGGGGGGNWGETGWDRMFSSSIGGQISWLIPAALILLAAALWATRKLKRTDTTRAAFLLWGGSLLITMVIFSFMQGIFHEYYTVALAPYIAPLIGMGAALLWEQRDKYWASITLAAATTATAVWGYVLLNRSSDYLPWLKWVVLVGGLVAALGLVFVARLGRRLALAVVGLSLVTAVAGPTAYTLTTLNEGHTGSIVTAGPSTRGGMGGGPGGGGGGMGGGPGGGMPGQNNQQNQQGNGQNQQGNGQMGQPPTGGFGGGQNQQQGQQGQGQQGQGNGTTQNGDGGRMGDGGGGGGMGGLINGTSVSDEAKELLEKNASDYTWAAAAVGAQNAASYQLSTGEPVMAIGGFNGTDPSPTLAEFKKYVEDGKIHYFIAGGSGGGRGGSSDGTSSQISSWVQENFEAVTVDGTTFYDLTQAK
ncbi:ArnT family glycosyltransferase [Streptomyces caniscabiei]|uniref:Glycosyltransferase family 39 protein n=1 Tax=Streptomyces caniscabiei TaxID=2746961 RepID=A0ABU4N467_9ACTN|nr:glycosyltransferase family 39 protein [Streptomyces caniscabiei]MBE4740443.1 glycosyltransferase family 39 protein [Streptomyces caniscabiei]MBE4761254.1 glycosyltransferase family 39 protein [Streptomyces caniscabiei]MBE4773405.1 glycosyltransferase family 39 protein [Streptomyces caniscabiei]MBE4790148.1 glycosyltransferase family 39 protein [Streptomyces caniscabiei]MBE4799264.1 glycosyltransferase family 39 protein [Streptomyces caniscabiei]